MWALDYIKVFHLGLGINEIFEEYIIAEMYSKVSLSVASSEYRNVTSFSVVRSQLANLAVQQPVPLHTAYLQYSCDNC